MLWCYLLIFISFLIKFYTFLGHWSDAETKLLIASYSDCEKDKAYKFNRNKFWTAVYKKVEKHSKKTFIQCKRKMENLERKYKKITEKGSLSGAAANEWSYYNVSTMFKLCRLN